MSIKRTIITTIVTLAVVASIAPAFAGAITVADLQAQINALLAQLQQLQGTTNTTTTGTVPAACVGVTFTRNLTVGATGSDVKCLQVILNMSASTKVSATGAGSPGYETTTFGPKTLAAVKIWQAAQGLTPANQIGPMSRAKLNAWLGGSTTTTTTTTTTGNPVVVQSGSISAALAYDTPASGAIIGGQATADLLHINFTGTGVVTSVTLQRSGISDQNLFTNVYLYDGNIRITDGYSFNVSGQLVMNGLNIIVNGSHTISVKGDVVAAASSTEGSAMVTMTGFTGNGAQMSANVSGNLMSVVSGTLAGATIGTQTVGTASINAGTMAYTFWSAPVTVTTRAVYLKTANFKMVGSAPSDALGNIKMFVDGIDTGKVATVAAINSSNYASFDLTAAPITLTTGSHTIDMRADVQKGSNRDVTVSVQQASDFTIADPQFGVNIAVAGTPNGAGKISISQGSITVTVDPTFASQTNVSGGASNAVIGRFKIHAYGEDVKISTLQVNPLVVSGATATASSCTTDAAGNETTTTCGLQNVTLYFNGTQVGSQANFTQTVSMNENSTTAKNDMAVFSLGSQMIAPAGQDSILEVRADLLTTGSLAYTSGTVKVILPFQATGTTVNYLNGQGQTSQATTSVPASTVSTSGLSISAGGLVVAKNTGYLNQAVSPNTTGVKIGSFTIQNQSTSESIRLTQFKVLTYIDSNATPVAATDITDLSALRTSDTTGSGSTPIQPTGSDTFSVTDVLAPGASMTLDIFANTSTNASDAIMTLLQVSSIGVVDNTSATFPISTTTGATTVSGSYYMSGQVLTLGTGTVANPTLVVSSTTPAQYIASAGGTTNAAQATFNFVSTSGASTITELKFVVSGGDNSPSNTVTNVCVGTICASPVSGVADVTGLNLVVPNGGSGLTQPVQVSFSSVGTGGITPGVQSRISLGYVKYTTGTSTKYVSMTTIPGTSTTCASVSGCVTLTGTNPSAYDASTTSQASYGITTQYLTLVGSYPTVTVPATVATGLQLGQSNQIGQVTVAANPKGAIKVSTIVFNVSGAGFSTTAGQTMSVSTSPFIAIGSTQVVGSTCTTTNVNTTQDTISCVLATTASYANDYAIAAGQQQTFNLYVTVTGVAATNSIASVSSSVTAASFLWDDTSFNGSAGSGKDTALTGSSIYGFPTNAYSIHQ